jgi:hypothetical protein
MNAFAWWWAFCQSAISRSTLTAKCPPPRLRDPHRRDFKRVPTGDHAVGRRGREPGADKLDHLRDGETVREHYRLGAAVTAGGQQFERAAVVGLGAIAAA